ncbi:DUF6415 family natural product biosynthesis protein [Streptomyces hirsutus]|uniref:DUF6415 family natural product biosynthesis protein n=1 Tax=Streptomyces hirsutus TaxID=35620 RepID=UPI000A81AE73|nr:DUF6415 family natural product biosynthesis protein [Streptomyces hirsutus]
MRLSLAPWQADGQRAMPGRKARVTDEPVRRRDQAAATAETVALVLDEESPLPQTSADVEDLARRLRGHIDQLVVMVPNEEPALRRAQQLGSAEVPDSYVPSRVYLVQLAKVTQELATAVGTCGSHRAKQQRGRRRWTPGINVLRGTVFALALACLFLAASVPRA